MSDEEMEGITNTDVFFWCLNLIHLAYGNTCKFKVFGIVGTKYNRVGFLEVIFVLLKTIVI